eukprot:155271-Amphidinium_carterae.1
MRQDIGCPSRQKLLWTGTAICLSFARRFGYVGVDAAKCCFVSDLGHPMSGRRILGSLQDQRPR